MSETKLYITSLFSQKKITVATNRAHLFEAFLNDETNISAVKQIQQNQQAMLDKWELKNKIEDIINKQLMIPNATANKPYKAKIDFEKLGMGNIVFSDFEGLTEYGLKYDNSAEEIHGIPEKSGDFKIKMRFRVKDEAEDSVLNEKLVSLVINADPKSLWQTKESNQHDPYWKPDDVSDFQSLGKEKYMVVSSKRGRSHANVGSFRDDDFSFKHYKEIGWSLVCVADGAGSAKLARQGSKLACDAVVNYFGENFSKALLKDFDETLLNYHHKTGEETEKKISFFVYDNLSKAAHFAHKKIEEFANKLEVPLKDFHSTLIFALFKKYDFGYAILTFGVGDCPIGLLNKDLTEIKLMNWLDVGEFGGGTRFITMPEIFSSDKFSTRFGFKLIADFSYLILMTDGIYDPKFVVEVNLEKIEKWKEFLIDLEGNNEEKIKVELKHDNKKIAEQLSAWMDFWSPGNHDDRTLAIVF